MGTGSQGSGRVEGRMMMRRDATLRPPVAAERPHEVVAPHGTRRDEYFWLRDDSRSAPDVLAYLEAENAYTDAVLAPLKPLEDALFAEIVGRIKQDDASVPYRRRGFWYYTRYETGLEYPVYARRKDNLEAPEEVMLDGNALAAGSDFFEIGSIAVAPGERIIAYTEDRVGRRQYSLRFRDLETSAILPDQVHNVDPGVVWAADGRTALYVEKDPETLLPCRVRRHRLGTPVEQDELVYELEDDSLYLSVDHTKDDRYLLIVGAGHDATEVHYAAAGDPALAFRRMLSKEVGHEYYPDHLDGRWIIRSNWQAPNFRLVEVPVGQEGDRAAWRDLVAHREDASIEDFSVFRRFLAINERSGGLLRVRIRPWDGGAETHLASDEPAFTMELGANLEVDSDTVRYTHTSLTTPLTTYDHHVPSGGRTLLKREPVLGGFDPADYRSEHLWAEARDGARVPVSVVYRKDCPLDGSAPLLQYGYGAYGLSMDPEFSSARLSLLDRGFVYAIAHIRGGQELGRRWYDEGKLHNKLNSFTDFIDATRFLVREGYADPARVFARGGSAGGLLMGAVANLAPGDYRGVLTHVPFVDIVTTMLDESLPLTTLEYVEWGDPREREDYECMLSYSPYDNLAAREYPAMLVTTGLWDSQVQYFEPAKWVARLRRLKTGDNPLLLRTNMDAGHGGKSGRYRRYREIAEEFAFALDLAGLAAVAG
jgi:oligopeptidase B